MSTNVAARHKRVRDSQERADYHPQAMERSYDCPECNEAAFVVVRHPNILRCLPLRLPLGICTAATRGFFRRRAAAQTPLGCMKKDPAAVCPLYREIAHREGRVLRIDRVTLSDDFGALCRFNR